MTLTFASLKDALEQPFTPECIQFRPKDIHQENGRSMCLALPYANKRVYEDRLNELVFGEWSTPFTPPYAHDNKLIIPATVVILGVAHTDYGEAFMTATSKNGTTREDENTATGAYSQAFRRACAKFLLGRYLYDLPKLTLPYDPKTRQIAVSKAERIAWVEQLYQKKGLLPKKSPAPKPVAAADPTPVAQQPTVSATTPVPSNDQRASTAPPPKATQQAATTSVAQTHPTAYPDDTFLDWVCQSVHRDPKRIEGICTFYEVQELALLSEPQRAKLTRQLRHQAPSPASSPSHQAKH